MRRILLPRVEPLWRSRRNRFVLLGALVIATTLGALALDGVFSADETLPRAKQVQPAVSTKTLKALERVRHRTKQPPLYYLGLHFDGLPLVSVNDDEPVSLVYADCTTLELNTFDPACRRGLSVELWRPMQGEITTQGRCTFSGRVRGAAVALFPVSPHSLRVFTKATTVYISSLSLKDNLAAARALRGLNVRLTPSEPLPARDVSRELGRCRTPKKQPPLTLKQRYQRQMQESWTLASALTLNLPDPTVLDNPSAGRAFLANVGTFPLLLRNEATRLSDVRPPAEVAGLQTKLIAELQAYADDVDLSIELIRSGAWHDKSTYLAKRKELEARVERHSEAIDAIVVSFRKHGYVIAQKTGD